MVTIGDITLGDFPILLAPMEDVTDPPFRCVCKMMGADMMYTEFISSEGLIRDADKSVKKLDFFNSTTKALASYSVKLKFKSCWMSNLSSILSPLYSLFVTTKLCNYMSMKKILLLISRFVLYYGKIKILHKNLLKNNSFMRCEQW